MRGGEEGRQGGERAGEEGRGKEARADVEKCRREEGMRG